MRKLALVLALGIAAAAPTAFAAAARTVIDFSGAPLPDCYTSYTESGVTFSAVDGGGLTSSFGNTPNGTTGTIGCGQLPDPVNPVFSLIRADFAQPFTGIVSVDLGDFDFDSDLLQLRLFNASNMLLSSRSLTIPADASDMFTLGVFGRNVDHAIFGSVGADGSTVFADNFSLLVPEPASTLLLGVGLLGAGLARRRR